MDSLWKSTQEYEISIALITSAFFLLRRLVPWLCVEGHVFVFLPRVTGDR